MMRLLAISVFTLILSHAFGFQTILVPSRPAVSVIRSSLLRESQVGGESSAVSSSSSEATSTLKELLKEEFPAFYSLLSMNDEIWKTIAEKETSTGCTIFAPSDTAFDNLGEKKLLQLKDARNEETAKKMGLYHVVTEPVMAAKLRTEDWTGPKPTDGSPRPIKVKALVTMGGEVPVGRSKSGGLFMGLIGGKEDGDAVIGPDAKMIKSFKVGNSFVHEVDALISPVVLWRYCDQLRIPGF
jgi:uncharacterized surface protein with fasciclin (FAS1) repeats